MRNTLEEYNNYKDEAIKIITKIKNSIDNSPLIPYSLAIEKISNGLNIKKNHARLIIKKLEKEEKLKRINCSKYHNFRHKYTFYELINDVKKIKFIYINSDSKKVNEFIANKLQYNLEKRHSLLRFLDILGFDKENIKYIIAIAETKNITDEGIKYSNGSEVNENKVIIKDQIKKEILNYLNLIQNENTFNKNDSKQINNEIYNKKFNKINKEIWYKYISNAKKSLIEIGKIEYIKIIPNLLEHHKFYILKEDQEKFFNWLIDEISNNEAYKAKSPAQQKEVWYSIINNTKINEKVINIKELPVYNKIKYKLEELDKQNNLLRKVPNI
ncbi:MAG: hypothetical protein ACP5UN_01945 [Candidatus Micrarchaeia archaeon]